MEKNDCCKNCFNNICCGTMKFLACSQNGWCFFECRCDAKKVAPVFRKTIKNIKDEAK